jgi:translation initiation factor 5B
LRKEGKLLSKSQKQKKQQDQLRLQQMMEAGLKVEGLSQDGEQKPKKVVYSNKKRQSNKQRAVQVETESSTTEMKDTTEPVKEKVEIKEGLSLIIT